MDVKRLATLDAKPRLTSDEYVEWARLHGEKLAEEKAARIKAEEEAAMLAKVRAEVERAIRDEVKRVAPVVDMNAIKYPMARLAAENLPKLHKGQAPEPEPEPGSALEYSRHHTVTTVH